MEPLHCWIICIIIVLTVPCVPCAKLKGSKKPCESNQVRNKTTNKCECPKGLKRFSDSNPRCEPACDNCPLELGRCTGPNLCQCYKDYVKNSTDHCVKPECLPGGCKPNGQCTKDHRCECDPGYQCLPVCDFCVDDVDNCTMGTTRCTCWDSYKEQEDVTKDNRRVRRCRPKCTPDCINGKCVEATTCHCHDGFQMRNGSRNQCDPICKPACRNGDCIAPDTCQCHTGYERPAEHKLLAYDDVCVPVCQEPCARNARCVAPDRCECSDGYEGDQCDQAICRQPCGVNKRCVEPQRCACLEGFTLAAGGDECVAVCDPACANGACIAPNICECAPGWTGTLCDKPTCGQGCGENARCVEPERCECNDGYGPVDTNECAPICKPGCVNGACIEPGTCTCDAGYKFMKNSYTTCVPDCPFECEKSNGTCRTPGQCVCSDGFILKAGSCVPDCINGEPYRAGGALLATNCTCLPSFVLDAHNPRLCQRIPEPTTTTASETSNDEASGSDFSTNQIMDESSATTTLSSAQNTDANEVTTNDSAFLHVGGFMYPLWPYVIATVLALVIAVISLIIWNMRKIDYNVKKWESKLGVQCNAAGGMAYA